MVKETSGQVLIDCYHRSYLSTIQRKEKIYTMKDFYHRECSLNLGWGRGAEILIHDLMQNRDKMSFCYMSKERVK